MFCGFGIFHIWENPHEYFNMYFFEFLLWYYYGNGMVLTMVFAMVKTMGDTP